MEHRKHNLDRLVGRTRWVAGAALAFGGVLLEGVLLEVDDVEKGLVALAGVVLVWLPVFATLAQLAFRFLPKLVQALGAVRAELFGDGPAPPNSLSTEARRVKMGCDVLGCLGACLLVPLCLAVMTLGKRLDWSASLFAFAAFPTSIALPVLLGRFFRDASEGLLLVGGRIAASVQLQPSVPSDFDEQQHSLVRTHSKKIRESGGWLCLDSIFIAGLILVGTLLYGFSAGSGVGLSGRQLYLALGGPALACACTAGIFGLGVYARQLGDVLEGLASGAADLRAARHGELKYSKPVSTDRLVAAGNSCRIFGYLAGLCGSLACLGLLWLALQRGPRTPWLLVAPLLGAGLCLLGALPCLLGSIAAEAAAYLTTCCRRLHENILASEQAVADGEENG